MCCWLLCLARIAAAQGGQRQIFWETRRACTVVGKWHNRRRCVVQDGTRAWGFRPHRKRLRSFHLETQKRLGFLSPKAGETVAEQALLHTPRLAGLFLPQPGLALGVPRWAGRVEHRASSSRSQRYAFGSSASPRLRACPSGRCPSSRCRGTPGLHPIGSKKVIVVVVIV